MAALAGCTGLGPDNVPPEEADFTVTTEGEPSSTWRIHFSYAGHAHLEDPYAALALRAASGDARPAAGTWQRTVHLSPNAPFRESFLVAALHEDACLIVELSAHEAGSEIHARFDIKIQRADAGFDVQVREAAGYWEGAEFHWSAENPCGT
jgi:hypothetical protein